MGKKVKKAARNAQKEKQSRVSSPKTASQEIVPASNTVVDGVPVIKETKSCPHLDKGINLEKFSLKMASVESLKCDDCREGVADRRTKKGKGKNGKKGSGSKSESLSIWVCLECGHFSCGGVGFPTTPQSHAARHAKQNRHPLVFQFANHNLRWCFLCNTLIPVQSSDQNGEQKDVLSEFVKVFKTRSSPETRVDVEDTWFGSGSVTSGVKIKSVNTLPSCSETRGGYMVRGLVNLGNTCFFNSVLQNLLAMDKLRDFFLKLEGSVGPLTVSLKKLFVESSPSTGVRNVINPRSFFGCVCAKAPQFRGYQQHDSHELLRCLLDGLCTEECGVRKRAVEGNTAPKQAPTFVDTIFGGQISSTVSCLECGHASVVYEPYLDLSLPLPTKRSPSKKAPSVSRSKKPKLPPKRQPKRLSKTKKSSDASVAQNVPNISISDESSEPVKSIEACAQTNIASEGDSARLESAVLDSAGDLNDSSLQKPTVLQENGSKRINDSTIKESVISSDNLVQPDYVEQVTLSNNHEKATMNSSNFSTLLDYSEPSMVSNDRDTATHLGDVSVTEHTVKKELVQDELLQSTMEASEQVDSIDSVETPSPLPDELSWLEYLEPSTSTIDDMASHNQEPSVIQDSRNMNGISREDEPLLKVRESEVLLLPYKEVTSTNGDSEVTLSSVTTKQEPSDFDGFGGMFDEPEVAAGPSVKNPLSNGVEGSGFMVTSNSESDPDEVDHTDSPVSVEKCLAYFTTPELLTKTEHAWQCEQCSKSLLEQRTRLKNKLQKPVSNGGENKVSSASSDSDIKHLLPNGVRHLDDQSTESAVLGESDENSVLHNGKSENNLVASDLEEGKTVVNSANVEPPHHPVTSLSNEHCSDTESCSVNKPTDKFKNDNVQQRESKILAMQQELDSSEDEEVDSKGVKVARDASKRILISRAPPVLTIHLKRFCQDARGRLSKLSGHVNFRDTIDLKPYMDPSCCKDKESYKYQLVGVVEHLGTMRGGHYVAYVKGGAKGDLAGAEDSGDHLWYHASDAYVRETSLEEVLRCEAYILFYEEMDVIESIPRKEQEKPVS